MIVILVVRRARKGLSLLYRALVFESVLIRKSDQAAEQVQESGTFDRLKEIEAKREVSAYDRKIDCVPVQRDNTIPSEYVLGRSRGGVGGLIFDDRHRFLSNPKISLDQNVVVGRVCSTFIIIICAWVEGLSTE